MRLRQIDRSHDLPNFGGKRGADVDRHVTCSALESTRTTRNHVIEYAFGLARHRVRYYFNAKKDRACDFPVDRYAFALRFGIADNVYRSRP